MFNNFKKKADKMGHGNKEYTIIRIRLPFYNDLLNYVDIKYYTNFINYGIEPTVENVYHYWLERQALYIIQSYVASCHYVDITDKFTQEEMEEFIGKLICDAAKISITNRLKEIEEKIQGGRQNET